MEAPTINMPPEEAQSKLEEYRESMRRRTDAEHAALVEAYEALAAGTPLISLQDSIQAAGFDEKMRPRIAIARSDRQQVHFQWWSHRSRAIFDAHHPNARRRSDELVVGVEMGQHHGLENGRGWGITVRGYALVPMIPADVRNRMSGQPREHFTLWEVEEWSDSPLRAEPDRDPLLLRHLHGDLYAVLDSWDLTDIERFVMRGRAER